jgi:hypothetical protein
MLTKNQSVEIDQKDLDAIRQTALDYMDGWYESDEGRVTRALHTDVVKRNIDDNGLQELSTEVFIDFMRKGEGSKFKGDRQITITILDIFKNIATLRVESAEYYDYVHIGKVNGTWAIINVLWEFKTL